MGRSFPVLLERFPFLPSPYWGNQAFHLKSRLADLGLSLFLPQRRDRRSLLRDRFVCISFSCFCFSLAFFLSFSILRILPNSPFFDTKTCNKSLQDDTGSSASSRHHRYEPRPFFPQLLPHAAPFAHFDIKLFFQLPPTFVFGLDLTLLCTALLFSSQSSVTIYCLVIIVLRHRSSIGRMV